MTVEDGYTLKDSDYPAVPGKTGYTGEWVKYTSAVHSNVTVQAKYTAVVAKYTVTFKADNTVVKTMTVKDGYTLKASDYPTVPAKSGYTGEWVKYTSAIHSNVTVQAKYTAVVTKYTVFFKADGFTVKAIQVNDGYVLQDADYPEVPAKVGCNGAWEKHTAAIHSNVTINAVYSPISSHYTVTFKANGATLKTMTVADGYVLKTSDYPTIPKRAGYTGSWPKTGAIHANTTITAVYTKDSGIVIPTQPTSPGEIMSGGEGEPVEADAPAEDETVAPQGTHVTGTQTVTHEYLTLNGKVARETIRTNNTLTGVLDFIYDESGKPFALKYSTDGATFDTYYYVLNLQGDVVKLIQANGHIVAQYTYDAWGNVSSSGRLAEINPLRYRGYYYDSETGFYYLQSRYYDPANRRFINADVYASTGQGFVGTNMFAYCNNKPIINSDPSGHALRSNLTAICDGGSGYLDRTKDVKRVLRENYEQAKRWGWELDGPFEFYDAVKDGGKWDYKLHPDGSEWIPRNGVFSVNGKKMTAEQLGNINYGFTGSVLGFPAPVLRMAGGFVAIKNSGINWEDWWYDFDSKEDAEMIQLGIDMEYLMTITGYSTDEVVDFFWK